MVFVIQGMKYDTEKMRKVATVKKWYREDTFLNRAMFPGQKVGRTHECELWKSEKGNWLLTHVIYRCCSNASLTPRCQAMRQ